MFLDKNKYFSTGEFARLCMVNKQTLFYYDKIGVFSPEIVLANGYRYYSYQQYEDFEVIYTLKEMGTPLDEIKQLMENRSPELLISLLEEKQEQLSANIQKLRRQRRQLGSVLDSMRLAMSVDLESLGIEYRESELIVIGEPSFAQSDKDDIQKLYSHFKYCEEKGLDDGYPICVSVPRRYLIESGDFTQYLYYSKIDYSRDDPAERTTPAGEYAVCYHCGHYNSVNTSYERLFEFIHSSGYVIAGDSYEQRISGPLAEKEIDKHITQISLPVLPAQRPDRPRATSLNKM